MGKQRKKDKPSPQTLQEAEAIAKGTQRPGQSKEQTKLIAQGIQKGIDQYKKQQKSRARELDKRAKNALKKELRNNELQPESEIVYKQHWFPWLLLILSWVIFIVLRVN